MFEKAKSLYEAHAPSSAAYARLLYDLGILYDDLKQKKRAMEHLEHAVRLYRTWEGKDTALDAAVYGQALCYLASLYGEHGCPSLAVSAFETALDVYERLSLTDPIQYGAFVPLIRSIIQDLR